MYLALFLAPWMLMYAASTLVMNHRALFIERYGPGPVPFVHERDVAYETTLPADVPVGDVARQILTALDLDGAHTATRRDDGVVVIQRADLLTPRRITFHPDEGRLVVDRLESRPNAFLERFHRRRGYATGYGLDTTWAATVDLVIVAMVFWGLSGLWLWWEMRVTRWLGAAAVFGGVALFGFYVLTI